MKRMLRMLLAVVFCLTVFSGCTTPRYKWGWPIPEYKGPLHCTRHVSVDWSDIPVELNEDMQNEILSILNSGVWEKSSATNSPGDYKLTTKKATIRYYVDDGLCVDLTNERMLILANEDRERINQLLEENS